jgi:hypothetical protein
MVLDDGSSGAAQNAAQSLVKMLSPPERELFGRVAAGEPLDALRRRRGIGTADAQKLRRSMVLQLHAEHTAGAVEIAVCAKFTAEPLA